MTQNNPGNLKVRAGDPLSAKLWNRTIDRIAAGRNGYGGAIDLYGQNLIPYVVEQPNGVEMGELVHIKGFDGKVDNDNPHDLGAQLRFQGDVPAWYTKSTRIAVAAEPGKKDEQLFGCVNGLALVKIKRVEGETEKRFVQVDPEEPNRARKATGGFAKILFEYGDDYVLVVMGERQNIWKYTLTQDVSAGGSEGSITLQNLTGEDYSPASMRFIPPVECKLSAGDTGLVAQCGNEFFALTSCSSFLGCPTSKDVLLYEELISPRWESCDLAGKYQNVKVFECETQPADWQIISPVTEIQVGTALSCQVKQCGQCTWQYHDTPVPGYTPIASCSHGCNCDEPVVANPQDQALYYTNCFGASGETSSLCFTLLTEPATVWDCGSGEGGQDECCVPIYEPSDCPDPCLVDP